MFARALPTRGLLIKITLLKDTETKGQRGYLPLPGLQDKQDSTSQRKGKGVDGAVPRLCFFRKYQRRNKTKPVLGLGEREGERGKEREREREREKEKERAREIIDHVSGWFPPDEAG